MFVIGPALRAFSDSISNMLMQHLCYYVKRRRECDFLAILRGIYFEFQSSTFGWRVEATTTTVHLLAKHDQLANEQVTYKFKQVTH